jgi:hypothetical protein
LRAKRKKYVADSRAGRLDSAQEHV